MFTNDVIREMEAQPFTYPASVNRALGEFLYGLTRTLRPELIVEIGCFIGLSTHHFAQALRENGKGKILAVDLFEPHKPVNLMNPLEIANSYLNKAQLEDIVTYVKGDSIEVSRRISPEIRERIDLLFIDGDHTVRGVFADFNAYYNDLKAGGYLLLHDINPEKCDCYGPRVLIDHLKGRRIIPKYLEITEISTVDGYGLAVLRKTHKKQVRARLGLSMSLIKWKFRASLENMRRSPSPSVTWNRGHEVGQEHVSALMRKMGIKTLYQKPRLSDPHPDHKIYPYLIGVTK